MRSKVLSLLLKVGVLLSVGTGGARPGGGIKRLPREVALPSMSIWPPPFWLDGIVPYVFAPGMSEGGVRAITTAMNTIVSQVEDPSCLQFTPKTPWLRSYLAFEEAEENASKKRGEVCGNDELNNNITDVNPPAPFSPPGGKWVIRVGPPGCGGGDGLYREILHALDIFPFKDGLSPAVVRRLREVYRCRVGGSVHSKPCPEGWARFSSRSEHKGKLSLTTSCYKVYGVPGRYSDHSGAMDVCGRHQAHLVHIDSPQELTLLARWLNSEHPNGASIWRIGGRRFGRFGSGKYAWDFGDGYAPRTPAAGVFVWKKGHPLSLPGLGLVFDGGALRFVDIGLSSAPFHPFICEFDAGRCPRSVKRNGRFYRGGANTTEHGRGCLKWTTLSLNTTGDWVVDNLKQTLIREGVGSHNFCRNPLGFRLKPWCYTSANNRGVRTGWGYCSVPDLC